jgi:hypothetical protein
MYYVLAISISGGACHARLQPCPAQCVELSSSGTNGDPSEHMDASNDCTPAFSRLLYSFFMLSLNQVRLVLDYFAERTPGSHVEARATSLVWNYAHTGGRCAGGHHLGGDHRALGLTHLPLLMRNACLNASVCMHVVCACCLGSEGRRLRPHSEEGSRGVELGQGS